MKPMNIILAYVYINSRGKLGQATSPLVDFKNRSHAFNSYVFYFFIISMLLFTSTAYCTTIVIVRETNQIIVAADSGKTTFSTVGDNKRVVPACKIEQNGSFFFVTAGLVYGPDFNALNIIHQIKARTISDAIKQFESIIYTPLSIDLSKLAQLNIENLPDFHVCFFGFENGQAHVHCRSWFLKKDSDSKFVLTEDPPWDCPGNNCQAYNPNKWQIQFLGFPEESSEYFATHKEELRKAQPAIIARKLVQMEIEAHPKETSEPIVILKLDPFEAEWIDNDNICPPLK